MVQGFVCRCMHNMFNLINSPRIVLVFPHIIQMHKLWTAKVDGGNGKEIYGDDYADIWAINRLHFKAGNNKTCDHVSWCFQFLIVSLLANKSDCLSASSSNCRRSVATPCRAVFWSG